MSQINTQLAYILHKRQYRESSQILDVFTRDYGRISLMSRGSRGAKSRIAGNLQLFSPLLINWQGRGSMPNLRSVERADIRPPRLMHKALLSAMYINELLMYLLHRDDIYETVFEHYHQTLYALEDLSQLEIELRKFEIKFLKLLGFGLLLEQDADTGACIEANHDYQYLVEHGLVAINRVAEREPVNSLLPSPVIQGSTILALLNEDYLSIQKEKAGMQQLKQLMRYVIAHHLGGRPLKSRELFARPGGFPDTGR